MDLTVVDVARNWVNLPFRDIPARHMIREIPHWTLFEICTVTLKCGVRGHGETMCYYTWGTVTDDTVAAAIGKNAPEIMWDDSLGAGLQMALFDAVGKAMDAPCWSLLGAKHRDRAPISWWDIDMDGEDWLSECRTAIDQGYTSFKTKARPWFDLDRQVSLLTRELPEWFDLDMDFNGMLVNTSHAMRVLRSLETYKNVAIVESPIPQNDVAGMKHLHETTRIPIALHYGVPPIATALREDVCDGFVVGGGASAIVKCGAVLAEAKKVFWLQLVGTGITAAWSLHFSAALSHARWPSVNCHQLYTNPLIRPGIAVADGMAAIPEGPGLGVELDEEAIVSNRIEPMDKPYPHPGLLIAIRWASGGTSYYTDTRQYWDDFLGGRLPVFQPGVNLEIIPDDGSGEWKQLQAEASLGGVHRSKET